MFPQRFPVPILALLTLSAMTFAFHQFCETSSKYQFCVAADTFFNRTSELTDLYVTFGYQNINSGGWKAINLGSSMFGALMFIGLLGQNDSPLLSIRHGRGHIEPSVSDARHDVRVARMTINSSLWYQTSFVYYGYNSWPMATPGRPQHFIWAANLLDVIDDPSTTVPLPMHRQFGHFTLDLSDGRLHDESPKFPSIDFTKPNTVTGTHRQNSSMRHTVLILHGTLMILAIMVAYPMGAICIRFSPQQPFRNHLICQLSGSMLCLIGFFIAVYGLLEFPLTLSHLVHVTCGSSIAMLVALQIFLGYFHHRAHVLKAPASYITTGHISLGRTIIVGGCANILLGLNLSGSRMPYMWVCFTLAFINTAIVASLIYLAYEEPPPIEEGAVSLLSYSE